MTGKLNHLNKYIHNHLINLLIDNCRLQSVPHCSIPGGITRFDLCGFGESPGRERSSFDLNGCRDAGGRSSDSGIFDDDCVGWTHLISVCGEYDDYDDDDIVLQNHFNFVRQLRRLRRLRRRRKCMSIHGKWHKCYTMK